MSKTIPLTGLDWVYAMHRILGSVGIFNHDEDAPLKCGVDSAAKQKRVGHLTGIEAVGEECKGRRVVRVTLEFDVDAVELDLASGTTHRASDMEKKEQERVEFGIKLIRQQMEVHGNEDTKATWEVIHEEWEHDGEINHTAYRAAMTAVDRLDAKLDSYTSGRKRKELENLRPPESAFMSVDGIDLRDELR